MQNISNNSQRGVVDHLDTEELSKEKEKNLLAIKNDHAWFVKG